MCDKKTSSIGHAQQTPVERVAEFVTAAENGINSLLRGHIQAIWPEGSEEGGAGLDRRIGDDGVAR
jgi:hypothetical protein